MIHTVMMSAIDAYNSTINLSQGFLSFSGNTLVALLHCPYLIR